MERDRVRTTVCPCGFHNLPVWSQMTAITPVFDALQVSICVNNDSE